MLFNIFSSIKLTITLLALFIIALSLGTFVDIFHSWWFFILLSLFGLNLLACTLKRLKLWRSKFGSAVTHVGLLVILAGALITRVLGEKGFLIVFEGHGQDTFVKRDGALKELDFKIYLDDFSIEWYDFKSKITVIEKGQPVLTKIVKVNRPLKYKGYAFYQASYDTKEFKWTGLEVVRDPGVPFVFAGFIMLNIGAIFTFYLGPRKKIK